VFVAITLRGLRKSFGHTVAVDDVDLDVPSGSFFGLVGPNGAGKTTTLSMVTGLLRPDAGTVSINGADVWSDPVRAKAAIGVLPEGLRLFERLSGAEMLQFVGQLRRMPVDVVRSRVAELLQVLDLDGAANTLVVDYSTGMRKKVGLAAALLHNPSVLILDEPFEAVDPVSAHTIRKVLHRYTSSGSTVVFSSHVMELVERLCDRLAVMSQGRIGAHGTLDEVRGSSPTLDEAFLGLVGGSRSNDGGGLEWLGSSSG
jgi:ABC-2 type transport system ATP-binding protein